jgi:hypothetical protein
MKCYADASFSKRLCEETQVELIGGKESYIAVCRSCYISSNNDSTINETNNTNVSNKKQFGDLTNIENLNTLSCLNATRMHNKNNNFVMNLI